METTKIEIKNNLAYLIRSRVFNDFSAEIGALDGAEVLLV